MCVSVCVCVCVTKCVLLQRVSRSCVFSVRDICPGISKSWVLKLDCGAHFTQQIKNCTHVVKRACRPLTALKTVLIKGSNHLSSWQPSSRQLHWASCGDFPSQCLQPLTTTHGQALGEVPLPECAINPPARQGHL